MLLCLFEDTHVPALRPLVDTRPVYDLRLGIRTLLETHQDAFAPTGTLLHARAYLAAITVEEHGLPVNRFPPGTGVLFVNGRLVPEPGPLLERLREMPRGAAAQIVHGDVLVAAWLPRVPEGFTLPDAVGPEAFEGFPAESAPDALFVRRADDLVYGVRDAVERDFEARTGGRHQIERPGADVQAGAHLVAPDRIVMRPGSRVHAGAVLDASNGPIYLDDDAIVHPNAVVRGPVYLGRASEAKALTTLEGVAIGPGCKMGGEVHTSVFHSFSNKGHQGFLGHACVGRWCNFGAGTNNSNLRNDYGSVSLYDYPTGTFVDTGHQFMGLVFGDHSKCSIDTTFNTGTVVGTACNLYGEGFHDRFIPGFTWGQPGAYVPFRLDKFMRVAALVMPRRDRSLTEAQREMLTTLFAEVHGLPPGAPER